MQSFLREIVVTLAPSATLPSDKGTALSGLIFLNFVNIFFILSVKFLLPDALRVLVPMLLNPLDHPHINLFISF